MQVKDVTGRMIIDSRGNPTVECTVYAEHAIGKAAAPSGASTGKFEAVELRDNGKEFHGKGVSKALASIGRIRDVIRGMSVLDQKAIDLAIIKADGTPNKSNFGANATTAVSLAVARAGAKVAGKELFAHLNPSASRLPVPFMNIINGGKHAGSGLAVQEFMVAPVGASSFSGAVRMCCEVYGTLRGLIEKKHGRKATGVGDEGGFAPPLKSTEDALSLIQSAIDAEGYSKEIRISLDCAASSFYLRKKYEIDGRRISAAKLSELYLELAGKYNIFSIEDPFDEEDFESFATLKKSAKFMVIGDDLTVTNVERIRKAIDMGCMDTLLLKVNQIGTLTEALDAAGLAKNNGCGVMVSHRSGETCDSFIADLAVALDCGMIKSGAPCRGERLAKYNRLLEIEEMLGTQAVYGLPK